VEAPGIEADSGQSEITIEHQSGTISTDADPANVSDRAPNCAIIRDVVTESSEAYELSDALAQDVLGHMPEAFGPGAEPRLPVEKVRNCAPPEPDDTECLLNGR